VTDAYLVESRDAALNLVSNRTGENTARVEFVIAESTAVKVTSIPGVTAAAELVTGPAGVMALATGEPMSRKMSPRCGRPGVSVALFPRESLWSPKMATCLANTGSPPDRAKPDHGLN